MKTKEEKISEIVNTSNLSNKRKRNLWIRLFIESSRDSTSQPYRFFLKIVHWNYSEQGRLTKINIGKDGLVSGNHYKKHYSKFKELISLINKIK